MISLEIAHPNDVIYGRWKHVASVETQDEILDILRFPDFQIDSVVCAHTIHHAFLVTQDRIVNVSEYSGWMKNIDHRTLFQFWTYCRAGSTMLQLCLRVLAVQQIVKFLAFHVRVSIEKDKGCNAAAEHELDTIEQWISNGKTTEGVFEAKHKTRSARSVVDGLSEVLGYATDALSTIVLSAGTESIDDSVFDVIHYIGLAESIRRRADLRATQEHVELIVAFSVRARIPFYDIVQGILRHDLPR